MSETRKTLTLMGEAMERAAQKIQTVQQAFVAPTPQEPQIPPPAPPHSYPTIRDRHSQDRYTYESMNDDDLAFEIVTVEESIESIKLDLTQEQQGLAERPPGWSARAQRALVTIKGQLALARLERDRRKRLDDEYREEQQRIEAEKRRAEHNEMLRVAHERKMEKLSRAAEEESIRAKRFVEYARNIISDEAFKEIWRAVNDEEGE
jgi:hypothetical protein